MTTEDERAATFRQSLLNRQRAELERARSLMGSQAARTALLDQWAPLILALQEAREHNGNEQTTERSSGSDGRRWRI